MGGPQFKKTKTYILYIPLMKIGKKLTVFLLDGIDFGPRTIEIGNWSGKAIYCPRANLHKLLKERSEFDRPGVYILKSDPKENIYGERVYIGEGENLKNRLKLHLNNAKRDFKECLIFISKDELLTKAHIRYLESRLVALANEAKNAEIENRNTPTQSVLSEAETSDMEYYLNQIKIILPTSGFSFLISNTSKSPEAFQNDKEEEEIIFQIKSNKEDKLFARLIEKNEGFVVLKGSEAKLNIKKSMSEGWIKLRNKLLNNGSLIMDKDKLLFTEDVVFSSPSAASSVILGRQSPGPLFWIDENGKTLKEYETYGINN